MSQVKSENDQYFFHPDHLGSTNYVTDRSGEIYQHLEYFPSGESWVEEVTETQNIPYRFSGKELDEETGLYYFEARYYDPRMSQFISADPLYAAKPEQALMNSQLFSLYSYALNNPLRYVDPDGRAPKGAIRILLVEPTKTNLTDAKRDSLKSTVQTQFQRAAGKKVTIQIETRQGKLSQQELAQLNKRDFVVYLLPDAGGKKLIGELAEAHVGSLKKLGISARDIQDQLNSGTRVGINVSSGQKNASFLNLSAWDRWSEYEEEGDPQYTPEAFGRSMGEFAAHEVAHGMGLENKHHGSEIFRDARSTDPANDPSFFDSGVTKKLRKRIRKLSR